MDAKTIYDKKRWFEYETNVLILTLIMHAKSSWIKYFEVFRERPWTTMLANCTKMKTAAATA